MKKENGLRDRKAVALSYKEKANAPKVVAKGRGKIADKIIGVGKKEKLTIYKDESLVNELIKLDLDDEIPPGLYEAVAKVILFVHQLDNEKEKNYE